MKNRSLLLSMFLCPLFANAHLLFIDKTNTDYSINEKCFKVDNNICYAFNVVCVSDSLQIVNSGVRPFIFLKIFDFEEKSLTIAKKTLACLTLQDYINSTVIIRLKADLLLDVSTLGSVSHEPNINVFDSLIIYDGKSYKLMTGVVEVNYYNLFDFKQIHIQQSNQTIINTMAKIAPMYRNERNNQMEVDIDSTNQIDFYGKLYLIKRENDKYTFRWVQVDHNEDSPFDYYYREFIYKKDYGIISFRSPYFIKSKNPDLKIFASSKMYDFK